MLITTRSSPYRALARDFEGVMRLNGPGENGCLRCFCILQLLGTVAGPPGLGVPKWDWLPAEL